MTTPLRQRMIEDMQIRNFSPQTIEGYVFYVAHFAEHFKKSPDLLRAQEIRQYQIHLLRDRKISFSTMKVAVSALRFLYKVTLRKEWAVEYLEYPRRSKRLPVVLSKEEILALLSSTRNLKHRTVLWIPLQSQA
jgi:site-specific recombinase XerD